MHCTLRHETNRKITHRICKPLQTRRVIVVGYLTPANFRAQNTLFGPMFVGVGTQTEISQGSYDVQTLKPSGDNVPNGETCVAGVDTITLVKLSATGGAGSSMLCWRDSKGEKWGKRDKQAYYGWYAGDTAKDPAELEIAPGEGLWVNSPVTTTSLVFPSPLKKDAE